MPRYPGFLEKLDKRKKAVFAPDIEVRFSCINVIHCCLEHTLSYGQVCRSDHMFLYELIQNSITGGTYMYPSSERGTYMYAQWFLYDNPRDGGLKLLAISRGNSTATTPQ